MSTDHQRASSPHADRQLLELHALRQRQLRTAFLHGTRRTWRERRRIWPAVVVALVLIALLVAGTSVVDAFHRQQVQNSSGTGFLAKESGGPGLLLDGFSIAAAGPRIG